MQKLTYLKKNCLNAVCLIICSQHIFARYFVTVDHLTVKV